uniref:Putative secreted protein n=1 Tax=Ixodes ricinus TaxID=34613 RepID=A0A090X9C2_IXORI
MDSRCFLRISVFFHAILVPACVAASRPNLVTPWEFKVTAVASKQDGGPESSLQQQHHLLVGRWAVFPERHHFQRHARRLVSGGCHQRTDPWRNAPRLSGPLLPRRHFGGRDSPVERMLGVPVATVDVRDKAARNASYELSVGDLLAWEREHGRLPDGCLLFVNTGWSKAREPIRTLRPRSTHRYIIQKRVYGQL